MAKTAGTVAVAVGLVVAGLVGTEPAAFGAEPPPGAKGTTLTVLVANSAGVPADILGQAREVAARIFHDIGVELVWQEQHDAHLEGVDIFGSLVMVHLLNREMTDRVGAPDGVLGLAAGTDLAMAFYNRIEGLSPTRNNNDIACMLGHVIAHEIGHLLLPRKEHSRLGIMQAVLDTHLAARNGLYFTTTQAHSIRTKLGAS